MKHIFGWPLVAATGLIVGVNALYMLISPRAWFRLPRWIRAEGSLTKENYSTGWGAIQVRLTGALTLALIGWVIYEFFFDRG
jgi:hypothetical protein